MTGCRFRLLVLMQNILELERPGDGSIWWAVVVAAGRFKCLPFSCVHVITFWPEEELMNFRNLTQVVVRIAWRMRRSKSCINKSLLLAHCVRCCLLKPLLAQRSSATQVACQQSLQLGYLMFYYCLKFCRVPFWCLK